MKKTNRLLAILLAVMMIAALAIPAMAADETHTITISGAVDGETYTAYKLLGATYNDADDVLGEDSAVAYYYEGTATDPLYLILANYFEFEGFVDGKAYVKVMDGSTKIDYSSVDVAALAAEIMAADPSVLPAAAGSDTASGGTATITVSGKGYYFVDTSLGSICAIDTAGTVDIYEKNSAPSITKEVQEDTTGAWYTATASDGLTVGVATAAVGQEITFRLTVNTGTNANSVRTANGVDADYVIVDTLPAELWALGQFSVSPSTIHVNPVTDNAAHTITMVLDADEVAALGQNANIVITYTTKFVPGVEANREYTNTATLTYKEQISSASASVKTYEFSILKTDENDRALEGVTFTVQRADGWYLQASGGIAWAATAPATPLTTDANGKIVITGIDDEAYTVTELETLPGYNALDEAITVTVDIEGVATGNGVSDNVLTVVNYSGTVLPSTGGHGVVYFYIIGGVLVVAAAVLLVVRKRVSRES